MLSKLFLEDIPLFNLYNTFFVPIPIDVTDSHSELEKPLNVKTNNGGSQVFFEKWSSLKILTNVWPQLNYFEFQQIHFLVSGVNYAKAVSSCLDMGAEIAQPTNEIDSFTLTNLLTNFTAGMLARIFWIGE